MEEKKLSLPEIHEELLEQLQIFRPHSVGHRRTELRMQIVPVVSDQAYRFAVKKNPAFLCFNGAQTELFNDLIVITFNFQRVQHRIFQTP